MKFHLLLIFILIAVARPALAYSPSAVTAIRSGNLDELRRQLDQGAPADFVTPKESWGQGNESLILLAFLKNRPDMVRLLLQRGANVDQAALDVFRRMGSVTNTSAPREIVTALIEHGFSPEGMLKDGTPPLNQAIAQPLVVELLLERGAKPDTLWKDSQNRVSTALGRCEADLQAGETALENLESNGSPLVLVQTIRANNAALAQSARNLLKAGANPNTVIAYPGLQVPIVMSSYSSKRKTLLPSLLAAGADVTVLNASKVSLLHIAAENRDSGAARDFIVAARARFAQQVMNEVEVER
jgi:ankyrin repeat protein